MGLWLYNFFTGSMFRSLRELCVKWLMPEITGEIPLFSLPPPCKFLSCSLTLFLHAYLKKTTQNTKMFQAFPQIPSPDRSSPMIVQSLLHKGIRALLNSSLQRLLVFWNSYWKRNIWNLHRAHRWLCVINIVIG